MTETNTPAAPARELPAWVDRITPRAGVRVQLFSAALLWMVGVGFLLVRGVLFMRVPGPGFHLSYWLAPIAALAVVIGVVKAQLILIRYANKAVARIRHRGHKCYFGFFGWTSWAFILVMMGGGILLRHSVLATLPWGRATLSVIYIAVGTGLAIADRVFWIAALSPAESVTPQPVGE